MLAMFTVSRTFHTIRARITVDCERKQASIVITVNGRIIQMRDMAAFEDVATPEKAEAYLSKQVQVGPQGTASLIEALYHWHGRIAA